MTYTYKKILKTSQTIKTNVEKEYKLGVTSKWAYYIAKAILKPNKNIKKIQFNKAPKPKPKPKKEETTKTTKTKKTYDEPEKRTFFNSKGAGNANKIDNEAKKIKPTKN